MTAKDFDAVIVGGGPAGSAAALALLKRGARVAIVERKAVAEDRMGESLQGVGLEILRELRTGCREANGDASLVPTSGLLGRRVGRAVRDPLALRAGSAPG